MRIQDLAITGKAAREMIVERSQQIIAEHRKHNPQSATSANCEISPATRWIYRAKPNQAIGLSCQQRILTAPIVVLV